MIEAAAPPWRALRVLVVRSAGFPASWLAELGSGATVAALRRGDTAAEVGAVYEAEVAQTSASVIRRFHTEPELRDAVQFANPPLWRRMAPWLDRRVETMDAWRSADRQQTDTLTLMLQRYCAKNETVSHAGPITTAVFDPDRIGVMSTSVVPQRHPQLSPWAAEQLQTSFLGDAATAHRWWRPRIAPGCRLTDSGLGVIAYDFSKRHQSFPDAVTGVFQFSIPVREARLLRLCDGSRPVGEIRRQYEAEYGESLPEAEAVAMLRWLAESGAVLTGPELPYGGMDTLQPLRRLVAEVGDRDAERHLDSVGAALSGLAAAVGEPDRAAAITALETAFTAATSDSLYRAAGVTYGDRTIYNEDCDSEHGDMVLGQPLCDVIERDLAFVYDIFLMLPRARLRAVRRMMQHWFRDVFGVGAHVPVHDFVTACLRHDASLTAGYDEVESLLAVKQAALEQLLAPVDSTEPVHHIDDDAIAAACALAGEALPAVCNPDLMLCTDSPDGLVRGDFMAVVGDLHAAEEGLSHGLFAPWVAEACPDIELSAHVADAYRMILGEDEDLADVTHRHRNKSYARVDLPCLDIEAADRSPRPADSRARLHELMVSDSPRGLRLHLSNSDRSLRLTSPPLYWQGVRARNPFAVFSFPQRVDGLPLPLGARRHLPRLVRGRVVLQRAMWALPAAEFHDRDWHRGFLAVQRLRERERLPRHIFVKFPQELKPIYCDLDSPLLVRQVSRLARAAGNGRLVLSEMLPGPDQLWLTGNRGKVTSELRYAVFSADRTDMVRERALDSGQKEK